ncbi:hypothetical protein JY651_04325 [Pyxidicoccus parkwayensis]|uniref:Outer membrane protein beta-barrel domain-containing protein n=1 Tax=Pyxidicoccus parkwayensis TaxID=2813578 RepID=A0ABX7P0R9_9BACT|nr:hypothetical protein [Pyxidicoccus parkwaysis]QSQ24204.1 hypothetical protein JY651_04325 [Pyxidicoccus parkwaysis]
MPAPRALLSAALVACLLFAPGADARFGKHTSSDSKDDTHEATAIGSDEDDDDDDDDGHSSKGEGVQSSGSDGDGCCGGAASSLGEEIVGSLIRLMVEGLVYAIASTGTHLAPEHDAPGSDSEERRHAAPLSLRMGAVGMLPGEGASAMDLYFGLEERRFGVAASVLRLALPADDGTEGTDRLTLVEAHLSHVLYVHPKARLRAEAGVSTARAPDVLMVGPSLGLSVEACVLGPLDVEARAQVTPWPYRQVDGSAGLALHMGGFVMRGGWRGLFLDDLGAVDGISHQDSLHGPYFGLGFAF